MKLRKVMDIFTTCLQEVALEGLDGITLPTLWLRLNKREKIIPVTLTNSIKSSLWLYLVDHVEIQFYVLDKIRNEPDIFNRYSGRDPKTGSTTAIAPDELDKLVDVYPVQPVTDQLIKGSCKEYKTRLDVTGLIKETKMAMEDAIERFGHQQLVAVASQSVREAALLPPGVNPQVIEELAELEYCILERIGRSRYQGEIQTVLNNTVFKNLKASHIHYVMKSLIPKGLVTKQSYAYRRPDKNNKLYQQILLHLKSFKVVLKSTMYEKSSELCNALEMAVDKTMSLQNLSQMLQMPKPSFRQLKKKLISQGVIEEISKEKKQKHHFKELRLIKKDALKPAVEETEDDGEEAVAPPGDENVGLVAELPVVLQGFRYLVSLGEEGCSQQEMLNQLVGYGTLEGRHICRKINKSGHARSIMLERGKVCVQKYIANTFAQNSALTKQFLAERKKMQENLEISAMSVDEEEGTMNKTVDSSAVGTEIKSPNTSLVIVKEMTQLLPTTSGDVSFSELDDSTYSEQMSTDTPTQTGKRMNQLTTRRMRRTNLILSFVNEQKVIEGLFPIHKFLLVEETKLGETTKICKKTVARTVEKMHTDGLLKYIVIPVTSNEVTQDVDFVMSLDCSPSRFNTALEQAQFRVLSNETKKTTRNVAKEICNSDRPFSQISSISFHEESVKIEDLLPSIDYHEMGFQPKHIRAKAIHSYLWYLAYDHPNKVSSDCDQKPIDYDKVQVYNHELSWKRFLPPIPQHPDFGPGWVQVGEAGFLLPLSLICQFQRYNYKIQGIEEYLQDPLKKHTLVRHLPEKTKGLLLHKRKYLFSFINVIEMLCFMGLATLSNMKTSKSKCLKKEEEMVYIHKNIALMDTTPSEQSYMETSDNVSYEKIDYKLESLADVEKFWDRMKDICLITPLGVNQNNENNVDQHRYGVMLKKFIQEHVSRPNHLPRDDGSIPGDGKGACGFDSSLFSHLYRNWYRSMKTKKVAPQNGEVEAVVNGKNVSRLPRLTNSKIKLFGSTPKKRVSAGEKRGRRSVDGDATKKKKRKTKHSEGIPEPKKSDGGKSQTDSTESDYDLVSESNVGRSERVKGGRGNKRKTTTSTEKSTPQPPNKRKRKTQDRVRKKYVDPVDVASLKLLVDSSMGRPRSIFSPDEDAMLLVCKIASTVITNVISPKFKVIPLLAVRDVLRTNCAESRDKTSYACGRRIHVIMKNDHNRISHQISVADVMADKEFLKSAFSDFFTTGEQPPASLRENLSKLFKTLVTRLQTRLTRAPALCDVAIPDTIEELNRRYNAMKYDANQSSETFGKGRATSDVQTESDVERCAIESLIYATLYLEDKYSKYQAFKVFEKYPDKLVRSAWDVVHASGNLKLRKEGGFQTKHSFRVPGYRLSKAHYRYFEDRLLGPVYDETKETTELLKNDEPLVCGIKSSTSAVVLMATCLLSDQIHSDLDLPENIAFFSKNFSNNRPPISSTPVGKRGDDDDSNDVTQATLDSKHAFFDEEAPLKSREFPSFFRGFVSLVPCTVTLRNRTQKGEGKPLVNPDTETMLRRGLETLRSRTVTSSSHVIGEDLSEAVRRDVNEAMRNKLGLNVLALELVGFVEEAGVLGVIVSKLQPEFCEGRGYSRKSLDECLEHLCEHSILYLVGKLEWRVVTCKHATKWCVVGLKFKGSQEKLAEKLRQEFADSASLNNDVTASLTSEASTSNEVSTEDSMSLLDPGSFDPITFICRPWHNACAEIQIETACLILNGVFSHILWHPGVTLECLTLHFSQPMLKIEILQIIEVLVRSGCIERRTFKVKPTWNLFGSPSPSSVENENKKVYFVPTPEALLRMSQLKHMLVEKGVNVGFRSSP